MTGRDGANPLIEEGWALVTPADEDIEIVMGWFPDAAAVDRWSGPRFRYPFTPATFRGDARIDAIPTYCLRDPAGGLAAFGQYYERYDRAHLARLITRPDRRREGIGERLIRMIAQAAHSQNGYERSSLFVYRDNKPALRCYHKMGFVVQDYPKDAPMKEQCYFLTREHPFSGSRDP